MIFGIQKFIQSFLEARKTIRTIENIFVLTFLPVKYE